MTFVQPARDRETLVCDQCGATLTEAQPTVQAQAQLNAVQTIRCVALAAGVMQVTINGVTLTINGDFTYP